MPGLGLVAHVVGLRRDLLDALLVGGQVPVVAPLARDEEGIVCNVNADDAAAGIAAGLGARQLVLLTDVDGVRDADGRQLDTLTAGEAEALIASGVIARRHGARRSGPRSPALAWDGAEAIIADSAAPKRPRARPRRPDVRHPHHGGRGRPRATRDRTGTVAAAARHERSASASAPSASSSRASQVGSQEELVDLLGARGFAVTQATVSRDIAELGLVKVARGDRHVYVSRPRTSPRRRPAGRRPPPPDPRPTSRSRSGAAA